MKTLFGLLIIFWCIQIKWHLLKLYIHVPLKIIPHTPVCAPHFDKCPKQVGFSGRKAYQIWFINILTFWQSSVSVISWGMRIKWSFRDVWWLQDFLRALIFRLSNIMLVFLSFSFPLCPFLCCFFSLSLLKTDELMVLTHPEREREGGLAWGAVPAWCGQYMTRAHLSFRPGVFNLRFMAWRRGTVSTPEWKIVMCALIFL